MKRLLTTLIIASAMGGGAWYGKKQGWFERQEAAGGAVETPTAVVEKRDVDFSVEVSGDVAPEFTLVVVSEVGGKVKELLVKPGDRVKQGQVLVLIDDRDILSERESVRTEIEGTTVQVEKMTKNFERARELFEQKLISMEAYDNLESELALAKNSFERAQRKLQLVEDKLSKTKITAPGDGTVLTVPVTIGQVAIAAASVNNGTPLMTIANLERLVVTSHLNQVDVAKVKEGQNVKLRADSLKDVELEARVNRVALVASVKTNVKGFTMEAIIDKPTAALRPGMTVNMSIPIARADDAISVPVTAVFRGEGNKRIVFVQNGGVTEKREVQIGVSNIDHAQVLNGLHEGETILLVNPERAAKKRS